MPGTNSPQNLPYGSTGQIVRSNGAGVPPSFTTATYPSTAGTSGNVLTSDGTDFVSSPPAAGFYSLGYTSGKYYTTIMDGVVANGITAMTANAIWVSPWLVSTGITIDRISINVQSASSGGTRVRLGLYNVANGQPTTLAYDFGTVTTDATGYREITISQALTAGYYFVACHFESTPTVYRMNPSAGNTILNLGTSPALFSYNAWTYTGAFGSGLPDLTGVAPTNQFNAILTFVRIA